MTGEAANSGASVIGGFPIGERGQAQYVYIVDITARREQATRTPVGAVYFESIADSRLCGFASAREERPGSEQPALLGIKLKTLYHVSPKRNVVLAPTGTRFEGHGAFARFGRIVLPHSGAGKAGKSPNGAALV